MIFSWKDTHRKIFVATEEASRRGAFGMLRMSLEKISIQELSQSIFKLNVTAPDLSIR